MYLLYLFSGYTVSVPAKNNPYLTHLEHQVLSLHIPQTTPNYLHPLPNPRAPLNYHHPLLITTTVPASCTADTVTVTTSFSVTVSLTVSVSVNVTRVSSPGAPRSGLFGGGSVVGCGCCCPPPPPSVGVGSPPPSSVAVTVGVGRPRFRVLVRVGLGGTSLSSGTTAVTAGTVVALVCTTVVVRVVVGSSSLMGKTSRTSVGRGARRDEVVGMAVGSAAGRDRFGSTVMVTVTMPEDWVTVAVRVNWPSEEGAEEAGAEEAGDERAEETAGLPGAAPPPRSSSAAALLTQPRPTPSVVVMGRA